MYFAGLENSPNNFSEAHKLNDLVYMAMPFTLKASDLCRCNLAPDAEYTMDVLHIILTQR